MYDDGKSGYMEAICMPEMLTAITASSTIAILILARVRKESPMDATIQNADISARIVAR
ncbi:MAG: hypothetical protein KDJ90_00540 [Nitratireductor sp.]|nr:hypothetical protein [Nitratireductor sp.]